MALNTTGTAMVTLSPEDLAAIGALWEKYGDAIGRKDAAAAAALFADDCDGIALDGTVLKGRAEIREYYAHHLSGKYADLQITGVEFDAPRAISADVALMNGTWLVHNIQREPVRVRSTLVMRRDPEGWRYVAARFMAALPD
jgi:uncharacterized protein (TIGR02246 family)